MRRSHFPDKLFLALIICGICILLLLVFIPNFTTLRRLNRRFLILREKLAREQKQNQSFKEERDALEDDPHYLEKIAREKLGWASPEETIYRFPKDEEKD